MRNVFGAKFLCLFICLLAFQKLNATEIQLNHTEIYGTLHFLEAMVSENPNQDLRSQYFKKTFAESKYHNSFELKKSLRKFKDDFYDVIREFNPKLYKQVVLSASEAHDLAEFKTILHSRNLMRFLTVRNLVDYIKAWKPVYHELVFEAVHEEFSRDVHALKNFLKDADPLDQKYKKVRKFFALKESTSEKVIVNLVALPHSKKQEMIHANSMNVPTDTGPVVLQFIEVQSDNPKMKRNQTAFRFGLIWYGISQSFYETRQKELDQLLTKNTTTGYQSEAKQNIVKEALFTAIGLGYVAEENAAISWFADPKIDQLAKQITPHVRKYIDSGKSLDDALITKILEIEKTL